MSDKIKELKEMVKAMDGDFTAQLFGYEMNGQSIVEDFKWLIEQAEKLEEIKSAFYDKDTNVVECYRKQIEIFEGKEAPQRKTRS